MTERGREAPAVLLGALTLGGILRLWLAFGNYSVYWPDEIFKSLEPAHWLVSGDALLPWEFVEGANNWALPGLLSGILRLCGWLGLGDPQESVNMVREFSSRRRAWVPPAFLLLCPLALLAFPRTRGLLLAVVGFCLVHSLVPHKELRFLMPALPPLCALAAIGADNMARSAAARRALPAAMVVLAVISAARVPGLSFGDIGQGRLFDPAASAYSHSDEVNRLLFAAHRRRDLCGLKLEGDHIAFSGGYSHLDRRVRLYDFTGPPWESGFFNYVIGANHPGPATTVVASVGNWALMRLPNKTCLPDPVYAQRMRASGLTPS